VRPNLAALHVPPAVLAPNPAAEQVEPLRPCRSGAFELRDPGQLDRMCRELLANPLIEDFEVVTP